jgi:hypothetical protein
MPSKYLSFKLVCAPLWVSFHKMIDNGISDVGISFEVKDERKA